MLFNKYKKRLEIKIINEYSIKIILSSISKNYNSHFLKNDMNEKLTGH